MEQGHRRHNFIYPRRDWGRCGDLIAWLARDLGLGQNGLDNSLALGRRYGQHPELAVGRPQPLRVGHPGRRHRCDLGNLPQSRTGNTGDH